MYGVWYYAFSDDLQSDVNERFTDSRERRCEGEHGCELHGSVA